MHNDYSFEFLTCLEDYRKKVLIHTAFRAWRKNIVANRRRYSRACRALEFWSLNTMQKCFKSFKSFSDDTKQVQIPYSKGIYLILLAASTFLSEKATTVYGYRLDKIFNLFVKVKSISLYKLTVLE